MSEPRRCCDCRRDLPVESFGVIRPKKQRPYVRLFCRACAVIRHRAYMESGGGKEKKRERDNTPRGRKVNAEACRRFRATPRGAEVIREDRLRCQAKRRGAKISNLTVDQWKEIKAEFGGRCAYCGDSSKPLTRDHVLPISKGGNHTKGNIVPACLACNRRKWGRTPEEARMPIGYRLERA